MTPHRIDLCRMVDLMRAATCGREPNWRTMMTDEGAMVQDVFRALWERMRELVEENERLREK